MKKGLIIFLSVVMLTLFISIKFIDCNVKQKKLPEILFLNSVRYNMDKERRITIFYDKNGNCYSSRDKYVGALSTNDLIKEYKQGNLKNKIKFIGGRNKDELLANYMKLLKLNPKKIKILPSQVCLDVEMPNYNWYFVYYDCKNQIKLTCIHRRNETGDLDTNYKEVNDIYKWLEVN